MVYTVFYKTSSFAGYCFLDKNSIHPKRRDVFNFEHFKVTLVKFQICSFIELKLNFKKFTLFGTACFGCNVFVSELNVN